MALKGLDITVKGHDTKLQTLVIVGLAVAISGCAVSEKSPSSSQSADVSAARWKVIAAGDEDFELLEDELDEQMVQVADPLEPVNRLMYGLNDIIYFWVLKPVTRVYTDVIPQPGRIGIRNFFQNLTAPARFVNCLLQGKGDAAGTELHRFVVNSTEGVLGIGDPAQDRLGLQPVEEDLGQTLAVYGLGNGFYLLLPLAGPSTLRDAGGRAGDLFLNPVFYVEPTEAAIGISAVRTTNESSFHIGEYESFKDAAVDPYVAMRNAYIQYRNKKIKE
ncbi:MAG: MlaA family lipoprotein [Planctomycetota bacterium]|jgi:phospholipid-binding lipoprotein MlaA